MFFTYVVEAQVAGFCRNYGSWGSAKVPFTEWNLELIESMVDTMTSWWDVHGESLVDILDELRNTILKSLDALASQVKGMFCRYLLVKYSFSSTNLS
jgi:hypothetical protein